MTVSIVIRDSVPTDIRYIIDHLRALDKLESLGYGEEPHRMLFRVYKKAVYRKTVLIDDEPAAMYGVLGSFLGDIGTPYFATAEASDKLSPVVFTRIYLQEMNYIKTLFPKLQQLVDVDYKGAVRLLEMAGFIINKNYIIKGSNDVSFYVAQYGF